MSKSFDIEFTATPEQLLKFDEGRFFATIAERMGTLMARLRAKINANVHGEVLQSRSGRLAESLSGVNITREDDRLIGELDIGTDVPYAQVHERGGSGAFQIIAVNKQALRIMVQGKEEIFRKLVNRKQAIRRSYFLSAIDEMESEFLEELKQATIEGVSS